MIIDELEILSNHIQPEMQPRPVLSTIDTYDQNTQIDYPFAAPHVGRRPGWNVPSIAVTNESVNTIRSSAKTRFVSPSFPTAAGMTLNPIIPPTQTIGGVTQGTNFRAVPNMAQSIQVDSSVQVTFFLSLRTATAPDFVRLAIFRDGQQVSQLFEVSTTQANLPTVASGSYTDTDATLNKRHLYDLRWAPGSSQATADLKNRTFQVSSLRAQ